MLGLLSGAALACILGSSRAVEVAALALGATLGTRGINPINGIYELTDTVAVVAILAFSVLLGVAVWRETGALGRERPPAPA